MNNAWKNLTRKIGPTKEHIENFSSLIYMEHPFVVPSTGRFRELYYWDSYWTVKGGQFMSPFKKNEGEEKNQIVKSPFEKDFARDLEQFILFEKDKRI